MYFYIKGREWSVMEKGIALDKAEDITNQLYDSEQIVNVSEPWFSCLDSGTGDRTYSRGCHENVRSAQHTIRAVVRANEILN